MAPMMEARKYTMTQARVCDMSIKENDSKLLANELFRLEMRVQNETSGATICKSWRTRMVKLADKRSNRERKRTGCCSSG